jgi:hypothetical protein
MFQQIIEVNSADSNICCPICQHAVVDWSEEQYVQPCEHTLFIAMDLGFEFIADRFEQQMPRSVDEIHADESANFFEEIQKVHYEGVILVRSELGVDNMYRYTGFTAI